MKILFIGPPASGKGTIGKLLSEHTGIPIINTGALLRAVSKDHSQYNEIKETMAKGDIVSNIIVGNLLKEETSNPKYENGYILDGWLRQMSDKKDFFPKFDLVIFLNISEELIYERTGARKYCKAKGHGFNLINNPPAVPGVCDFDGSELVSRFDDAKEVVAHRVDTYKKLTSPVIEYFKKEGNLVEIDGAGPADIVFKRLLDKIKI